MMKKRVCFILCVLFLVVGLFSFVVANENVSADNSTSDEVLVLEKTKVDMAFECLVKELGPDCNGAKTVHQLAFSILASPNITVKCVAELEKKKQTSGCFGDSASCGIKETAWAILALRHVGKDVGSSVNWLTNQSKNSTDVEWFLQQDSEGETECKLTYQGSDYFFKAKDNKKLESSNLGSCFTLAQSDYWLRLNNNCLGGKFVLNCNKESHVGWTYRSPGSSVWNVLADFQRTAPNTPANLEVKSSCFGSGSSCNFEDTAWAVLALKGQGKDVSSFIPYLVSAEEMNTRYLPAALNYLILEWSSIYGTKLIQQQRDGQYWQADASEYGDVYDTALALLAIGSQNEEQVNNAKNWIWNFKQQADGCWNNKNIRDTAFLLWAIERRQAFVGDGPVVSPTTRCEEGGYFCAGQFECLGVNGSFQGLTSYSCAHVGYGKVCCDTNPVLSCEAQNGIICLSDKQCDGSTVSSSGGPCCLSSCVEQPTTSQCVQAGDNCRNFCLSGEEINDYACSGTQVCCTIKRDSEKGGIPLWLWLLIGILIILIILAIIFRDRIKAYYYKLKNKKNESAGLPGSPRPPFGPGGPPRPGFPPLNRPMGRQMPPGRPLPSQGPRPMSRPLMNQNFKSQDAFAKLKEMSK